VLQKPSMYADIACRASALDRFDVAIDKVNQHGPCINSAENPYGQIVPRLGWFKNVGGGLD